MMFLAELHKVRVSINIKNTDRVRAINRREGNIKIEVES